jgi:hypothetical protein
MPRGLTERRARKRLFGKEITKSSGRFRVVSGTIDDIFGAPLTRVAVPRNVEAQGKGATAYVGRLVAARIVAACDSSITSRLPVRSARSIAFFASLIRPTLK